MSSQRTQLQLDTWTKVWAKAVGMFFPKAANRFIQYRMALDYYTGATTKGPNKSWRPTNESADAMLMRDSKLLRSRARDLVRNYGHMSGALKRICNNVIFKGITPQWGRDDLFTAWSEWADAVALHDKLNLVLRHLWQDGEILIHFYLSPTLRNQGLMPLGIELLEIDHLDGSKHGHISGGVTYKRGIEYNREGWPIAYHLFDQHPGDSMWGLSGQSRRVPAQEIEHIYVPYRASQSRGEPWLSSIIIESRDLSEYKSSERLAARLAAAFGIFVKTNIPEAMTSNILGGDGAANLYDGPEYLEPARIQPLPPGTEIQTAKVDRPGRNYEPYVKGSLRDQSAGLGMSYEAYSNDYTGASYSSARSASLEERRGYQVQQVQLVNKVLRPIERRFKRMGDLMDRNWSDIKDATWQVPGWPWVDPDKDSKGAARDVSLGVQSRHNICANRGLDYDEIQQQLQQEEQDGYSRGK